MAASLSVGGAGVPFNPQSFVGSDAYKFIQGQGEEGIQRSAAAKGTLLTGGTLKDLSRFNQGNASTFWGNQLDHDYRMAALNADIAGGNANRQLSGLSTLSGYGMNAANGLAGAYGAYGQAGAQGTYGQASAMNQGMTGVANGLGEWFANRTPAPPKGYANLPMASANNPVPFSNAISGPSLYGTPPPNPGAMY